mgnify:CR=1 FL=1
MANVKHLFFDIGGVMLTNGWDHASRVPSGDQTYDWMPLGCVAITCASPPRMGSA